MAKKIKKSKILLLISLALFLILIIQLVFFFNAEPTIKINYVAEWNKMTKPENYDPNKNAFFDYEKAANLITEIPEEMSYNYSLPDWPGDMNGNERENIKKWVNDNSQAIQLFEQGSVKPYYWYQAPEENWNTSDIIFPFLSEIRLLTQLINWRAKLYAFENKPQQAFDYILTCLRVYNQFTGPDKTLIDQLVAISLKSITIEAIFEILANCKVDYNTLKHFQNQLKEELPKSKNRIYLEIEKIFARDIIQRTFSDDGKGNGHLIIKEYKKLFPEPIRVTIPVRPVTKPGPPSFLNWLKAFLSDIRSSFKKDKDDGRSSDFKIAWLALTGPDRKKTTKILDEALEYLYKIQEKTPQQLHNQGIDMNKELSKVLDSSILPLLGTERIIKITHMAKANESAVIITIALLLYKEENGAYPDLLLELIEDGFLKNLPQDPYNDGPLTYKKIGDDFTLYSFGKDFDDDGGEIRRGYNGKIERWEDEGDAVFWPRPKETEQQRQKRLEEQNQTPLQMMEEYLKKYLQDQDANDINSVKK